MPTTLSRPEPRQILRQRSATDTRPLVYIAAPYTSPDPVANTHVAIRIADALLEAGFTPLVPHLTLLWHLVSPKQYKTWLKYDCRLLARCDAVLRVPGPSHGADCEILFADSIGVPVIHARSSDPNSCVAALCQFYSNQKESR